MLQKLNNEKLNATNFYNLMSDYLGKNERFLNSTILNKKINEPHLFKGLLVIGGYGCGKTSIFKTFIPESITWSRKSKVHKSFGDIKYSLSTSISKPLS